MPDVKIGDDDWSQRPSWAAIRKDVLLGRLKPLDKVRGRRTAEMLAIEHPELRKAFPPDVLADYEARLAPAPTAVSEPKADPKPARTPVAPAPVAPAPSTKAKAKPSTPPAPATKPAPKPKPVVETAPKPKPAAPAPKPKARPKPEPKPKSKPLLASDEPDFDALLPKKKRRLGLWLVLLLALGAGLAYVYHVANDALLSEGDTPGTAPVESTSDTPADRPTGFSKAQREYAPEPAYPADRLDIAVAGSVTLSYDIAKSGRTENVRVTASTDPAFEDAAVSTMESWRYTPAMRDGEPVALEGTSHTFSFSPSADDVAAIAARQRATTTATMPAPAPQRSVTTQPSRTVPAATIPTPSNATPSTPASSSPASTASSGGATASDPSDDGLAPIGTLDRVPPPMPARAQRSGHCILRFDIDAQGRTQNVRKVSCSERIFERPSIKAVRRWRYDPLTHANRNTPRTGIEQRVSFRMTDGRGNAIPE